MKEVGIFWPGDYRDKPNEWARPQITEATRQLEHALKRLGRKPYVVEGFLTKPHESIQKLGPIDDPLIGVFVHWAYAPHTCDGVVGKNNPLLLASNFSGTWPGLVALLNTGASLESVNRAHSRIWTAADDWTQDMLFMERLEEWCSTGQIRYSTSELHTSAAVDAPAR
ncbi:MAG: fucose isomerase, partial [Gemmataceae bacterium]